MVGADGAALAVQEGLAGEGDAPKVYTGASNCDPTELFHQFFVFTPSRIINPIN